MQENYIVMLPKPEIGFYIQLESEEPIFQLTCFDQFSLVDFELSAVDSCFQEYSELKEINYAFTSLESLYKELNAQTSPLNVCEFHLTFENKQKLSFVNGELSASFDSTEFLHQFAAELLDLCGFNGKAMFQKLSKRTNCYLKISVEDQDYFNLIALAK
jgi:hypothetical protein